MEHKESLAKVITEANKISSLSESLNLQNKPFRILITPTSTNSTEKIGDVVEIDAITFNNSQETTVPIIVGRWSDVYFIELPENSIDTDDFNVYYGMGRYTNFQVSYWITYDKSTGAGVKWRNEFRNYLNKITALVYEDSNIVAPVRDGYKFEKWVDEDGSDFDFDNSSVTDNVNIVADWTKVHTVKFITPKGASTVSSQNVEDSGTASAPTDTTWTGYTFFRWEKVDGTAFDFSTQIEDSLTLIAVFKTAVTFNTDGGSSVATQNVVVGKTATEPTAPTKSGFKFFRWEESGRWFNFSESITKAITLTAYWKEAATVTFNSGGGTSVPAQLVFIGDKATRPADPTRVNHEFLGWFIGEDPFDFNTQITADTTVKASWVKLVTVTFNADGGTHTPDAQVIRTGTKAVEPEAPTKEGFDFGGWFKGEDEFDFSTEITANITLNAKWTAEELN